MRELEGRFGAKFGRRVYFWSCAQLGESTGNRTYIGTTAIARCGYLRCRPPAQRLKRRLSDLVKTGEGVTKATTPSTSRSRRRLWTSHKRGAGYLPGVSCCKRQLSTASMLKRQSLPT